MTDKPTYQASEIKALCQSIPVDHDTFKTLTDLIDEEIDLYGEEDLIILCQASMILFTRALLQGSLKFTK